MKLFVQRDKEFRSALYDIMGFYPHDVELYRIAFAHKSQEYKSKKTGDRPLNNERLEFLGDAVLETVVSDIVYHHFKNKREGFLTNTRSKIVSRESLGKLAKDLGIDRLIQSHTNSRAHNSFLAGNAFEALMGAIYLDRGFDYAFRFIEMRIMGSVLDLEGVAHKEVNFKSKLLEWSQKNRIRIEFKDKQTSNSGSTPSFFTTIILEGLFAGDGKGFSKKEAHQNASKDALTRMRREPKFIDDIFSSKEKRTAMEADPCFVLPVIDEIEADLARETEKKEAQDKREAKPKREPKAKKEQQSKKEQPKKEQPKKESKTAQPKAKQEPAQPEEKPAKSETKPAKTEIKQEKAESKQEKSERKQEKAETKREQPKSKPQSEPKAQAAKEETAEQVVAKAEPIVLPIALEEIFDEEVPAAEAEVAAAPAPADVPAEEEQISAEVEQTAAEAEQPSVATEQAPSAPAAEPVAEVAAPAEEAPAAPAEASAAPAAEEEAPAQAAATKKPRRRGKRQNAAGFTNTDIIPAETSHRADKAAKKVEEARKEKARKVAKKTARAAAKGIEDIDAAQPTTDAAPAAEASSAASTEKAAGKSGAKPRRKAKPTAKAAPAEKPAAEAPAKKPRRRRKTKAELPSETPNPERESTISAAEEAAYKQTDTE